MKFSKKSKQILLSRLKIIGICSLTLFSFFLIIGYIIGIYAVNSSIYYSEEENIIDDYGNLRTKEILVIENSLKSAMNEKRINFYFANVYEDINNEYASSFPDNSVIIYYNNNTCKLNVVSTLNDLSHKDLSISLDNTDELQYKFPEYIQNVLNNVPKTKNVKYYNSYDEQFGEFLICICGFTIITTFFIFYIFTIKKKIYNEIELIKIAKTWI